MEFVFNHYVFLERHWMKLIRDCRDGKINKYLPISKEQLKETSSWLQSMPERSMNLKAAFEKLNFSIGGAKHPIDQRSIDASNLASRILLEQSSIKSNSNDNIQENRKELGMSKIKKIKYEELYSLKWHEVPERLGWLNDESSLVRFLFLLYMLKLFFINYEFIKFYLILFIKIREN